MQNVLGRLNNLSMQPVPRQLAFLVGLAGSVALAFWLVQWALSPNQVPLYGQLSPTETSEVIQALEADNIAYTLDSRSGVVSIPADKVYQTRLKLASKGLPSGDGEGFDVLYKEQEMGLSSFMEKARYDRALEQELGRSIASLDSVKSARVHLALPKESAFIRKKNKPAASVLLNLYGGRELTESQLAGVIHMVASSVPGLEAAQVAVVDNQGRLLSQKSEANRDFSQSKEHIGYTRLLEQEYANRIESILTPILGVGAVKAQVAADVDFTLVEKTSEVYSPESSLRSEQLEEDRAETSTLGGIPGTLSNQVPVETTVSATPPDQDTSNAGRSSKRQIRNYELDKTISHIREAPGSLQKLSVAVVVDYQAQTNEQGEVERVPLSAEKLAEITTLVKETVGFSEQRGDSVNVVNASFVPLPELDAMPEPSLLEQPWVWQVLKLVLGAVALGLVLFTVIKPLLKVPATPVAGMGAPAQQAGRIGTQPQAAGEAGLAEDQVSLGYNQQLGLPSGGGHQQQINMARTMVEKEPERVAHVVKSWVASDD